MSNLELCSSLAVVRRSGSRPLYVASGVLDLFSSIDK